MKKLFLLSFFVSLFFVSHSNAQWWVQGGNLLWPHGNVTIQHDLNVEGTIANNGVRPYKVYTALLTIDEEELTITCTEFENTLGGTITWIRVSPGFYRGTFSLTWQFSKMVLFPMTPSLIFANTSSYTINFLSESNNTVRLLEYYNGSVADISVLQNIEIRLYP